MVTTNFKLFAPTESGVIHVFTGFISKFFKHCATYIATNIEEIHRKSLVI